MMFGKHTCTGGQGGVVYTKSEDLYWKVRQNSDRGKPFGLAENNGNCVASLNFNLDEMGSAIGRVQIQKIDSIAKRRREIAAQIFAGIERKDILRAPKLPAGAEPSYWFTRMILDVEKLTCDKHTFCVALQAEGLDVRENYDATPYMSEWAQEKKVFGNSGYPWAAPEYKGDHDMQYTVPENLAKVIKANINVHTFESFSEEDVNNVIKAINKVIAAYAK